jgi:hypothetical protein
MEWSKCELLYGYLKRRQRRDEGSCATALLRGNVDAARQFARWADLASELSLMALDWNLD